MNGSAPRAEARVVVPAGEDVAPIVAELDKRGIVYSITISDQARHLSVAGNGVVFRGGSALRDFIADRKCLSSLPTLIKEKK